MRYAIKIVDTAKKDLQEIAEYFAVTLQEKQKAKMQIRRIREMIFSLEEFPERYPLVQDAYLARKGYRVISLDHYLIFYIVKKQEQVIYISRILYEKRDWLHLL